MLGAIPWANILKLVATKDLEWVAQPYPFWFDVPTDEINFLSSSAADHMDSLFDNVDSLQQQGTPFRAETFFNTHMWNAGVHCQMLHEPIHQVCHHNAETCTCCGQDNLPRATEDHFNSRCPFM
jgi:hypothetical protein